MKGTGSGMTVSGVARFSDAEGGQSQWPPLTEITNLHIYWISLYFDLHVFCNMVLFRKSVVNMGIRQKKVPDHTKKKWTTLNLLKAN